MMKSKDIVGDFWGGSAAMLVALPSAIAFGVAIYASVGGHYAAYGAIAGILGVAAIGIVASVMGGTERLISAPSAPAAAVMSAFALEYMSHGNNSDVVFMLLIVIAFLAGLLQITFGAIGLGRMIKYMPFPVVSGYLSGVGLYIIMSQIPKFLGVPISFQLIESIQNPAQWHWHTIAVGLVTIITMLYADRLFRMIPAVIFALAVGVISYFGIGIFDHSLLTANNPFIIGELGGDGGINYFQILSSRMSQLSQFSWDHVVLLFFPALTLAALLSIDTLKTCIIVDSMTLSYHNPNKELIAQGTGNVISSLVGGMPGSGTMGATMVNIFSGASSRLSGVIEGLMAVVAFLVLGSFIAWIPVSALAGILIVVGYRMIDKKSIRLLKSRQTALDFLIIVAVALSAIFISLIAAAGIGLILAIALYIAQQIGISVVYRHMDGNEIRSKIVRNREETAILKEEGKYYSLYELHGSLFFGTANQLYTLLQRDLEEKKFIILDMKRVQTVDLTAAHILLQIKDILHDKGGYLVLCRLPHKLPTGDDLESYFNHVGLLKHLSPIVVFDDLDDALEWVEEKILAANLIEEKREERLGLKDFDLFEGRNEDTLLEMESLVEMRSYARGAHIFEKGDMGREIFLIRSGMVRIVLPIGERKNVHLSTLNQNSFFGEYAFLQGSPQYTSAIAITDTELYVISQEAFEQFSVHHKKASFHFMQDLAKVLAERLASANTELGIEYDV